MTTLNENGRDYFGWAQEMMAGKCIDPTRDWAFKKLFSIEKFLVSFLNCILQRPEDNPIKSLTYLQQEHPALAHDGRVCRFDILCKTQDNESIHIEVQNRNEANFEDRLLFYSALSIDKQGKKEKKWRYQLRPHYTVAICNFTLPHESENDGKYSYSYMMREEDSVHDVLTDALNVIIVELPKFGNAGEECNTLLKKWLFLLRNMHNLTPKEIDTMFTEEILKEFVDKATYEKLSDDEKIAYIMTIFDENARRYDIEDRIEKGYNKGREEERMSVAKNLLAMGLPMQKIADATKLSEEEITALKKEI